VKRLLLACATLVAAPAWAGVVKGRAVDGAGAPLAGVKVVVEHTVLHARYVHAVTDADGRYRAEVPDGSWNVTAQLQRAYDGRSYKLDLHPATAEPFAGKESVVRDFTLRVAGPRPGGGVYGATLTLYRDFFDPGLPLERVELTMTPDGPLLDGSAGNPLTVEPDASDRVVDVPLGRYRFAARLDGRPMAIRVRNRGDFAPSVLATPAPPNQEASFVELELEVRAVK
jgi:hypothetical protein